MNKTLLQDVEMTYPTWEIIKEFLGFNNNSLPETYFGNNAFRQTEESFWSTNIPNYSEPLVGIDIPVLLTPKKANGKTIVIVGESPLRDTKDTNNTNNVLLGTPYAVNQELGAPSQCNVYKKIFSALLSEGYSIYLTDIIKVWWNGKDLKADNNDKDILKMEIEDILKKGAIGKDIFIIAWGNNAGGILMKDYPFLIKLLHPGQNNWNNWKLHIFKKAIYDKKNIDYAKSKYPQKGSKTNENIVATEAKEEIIENVKKIQVDFNYYCNDEKNLDQLIADRYKNTGISEKQLQRAVKKGCKKATDNTFGDQNKAYVAWWIRQKMLQILKKQ